MTETQWLEVAKKYWRADEFEDAQVCALVAITKQLTRIADALERPARPDLSEMTANSQHDDVDKYRKAQAQTTPAELHDCTQLGKGDIDCDNCPDAKTCVHMAQGYDDLLCKHIYTGHQHDEPMTPNQDSRDSAGFPRP